MNQQEFTAYVISRLLNHFPQFKVCVVNRPGNIINIEIESPNKNFKLWITTQDVEITIGFTGLEDLNDWHTHITTYDYNYIDDDIVDAVNVVSSIINDEILILYTKEKGYTIFDPESHKQTSDKQIVVKYWSSW
ncbi:hypothetical protein ABZR88_17955 [Mucilaginibacter yixingensis]|uniref:hypothetical protein n=1 Tax=Mucilaginibacter yixingensis TaxID=1295612 RepID=UPI000D302CB5|nr:hypothetical protein [Mucilaginibacter yixingensis]